MSEKITVAIPRELLERLLDDSKMLFAARQRDGYSVRLLREMEDDIRQADRIIRDSGDKGQ